MYENMYCLYSKLIKFYIKGCINCTTQVNINSTKKEKKNYIEIFSSAKWSSQILSKIHSKNKIYLLLINTINY